jgi:hypothetical protein
VIQIHVLLSRPFPVLHQDSDNPLIRTVERTHLFGAFFLGDQFAESSINYISLK